MFNFNKYSEESFKAVLFPLTSPNTYGHFAFCVFHFEKVFAGAQRVKNSQRHSSWSPMVFKVPSNLSHYKIQRLSVYRQL